MGSIRIKKVRRKDGNKPELSIQRRDNIFANTVRMRDTLKVMTDEWYISHGACLGGVRGGDLIKYDRDADFIVNAELVDKKEVVDYILSCGFQRSARSDGYDLDHFRFIFTHIRPTGYHPMGICVYFYRRIDDDFYGVTVRDALSDECGFYMPSAFFGVKKDKITIRNEEFNTFYPVKTYLEWVYGEGWVTPDARRGFKNFSTDHFRGIENAKKALPDFQEKIANQED